LLTWGFDQDPPLDLVQEIHLARGPAAVAGGGLRLVDVAPGLLFSALPMVQVLLVLPVWALDPLGLVEFLLSIGDLLGFQLLGRVHLVPVRVFLCRCYMLQMPVVYAVQCPTVRPVLNAAGRDFPILIREVRNLHQSAVLHDDYRLLQLKYVSVGHTTYVRP
jgi:hypothetical protein